MQRGRAVNDCTCEDVEAARSPRTIEHALDPPFQCNSRSPHRGLFGIFNAIHVLLTHLARLSRAFVQTEAKLPPGMDHTVTQSYTQMKFVTLISRLGVAGLRWRKNCRTQL